MSSNKFLKDMASLTQNPYASIVDDGVEADVTGFIDTGVYSLNALLSGTIYGGMPSNKIMALAGESATGKTFFALSIVKTFLDNNPDAVCMYFDSEAAVTSEMFKTRGIDTKRVAVIGVATVEEFRHHAVKVVDNYLAMDAKDRKPIFMVLDSLGMLSSNKEVADTAEGKDTRDMTRAQITKATFRVLTLKLGMAGIPLLMTNHTYETMSMFPQKVMGGGCLTENHKVKMSGGYVKNIQDIRVGDSVVSMFGDRKVLNTFKYERAPTITLELEDGYSVRCTDNHQFLVKNAEHLSWVEASRLKKDDILVLNNNGLKEIKIVNNTICDDSTVYDIQVEHDKHYILENGLVSHNSGLRYSASTVLFLSKRKEKVDNEVVGNVIHCKLDKGRFTKENSMVDVLLRYDTGLNKYYGLLPIAEKYGIFKKVSTKYEMPDGTKVFEKTIVENPEKYFTKEILDQIDVAVGKEFKYGNEQEITE